jgi:hypothetical protein
MKYINSNYLRNLYSDIELKMIEYVVNFYETITESSSF